MHSAGPDSGYYQPFCFSSFKGKCSTLENVKSWKEKKEVSSNQFEQLYPPKLYGHFPGPPADFQWVLDLLLEFGTLCKLTRTLVTFGAAQHSLEELFTNLDEKNQWKEPRARFLELNHLDFAQKLLTREICRVVFLYFKGNLLEFQK